LPLDTRDKPSTVSDGPEGSAVEVVAVSIAASLEDMIAVAVEVGGRMEETMR
jgi:hypothetical protein